MRRAINIVQTLRQNSGRLGRSANGESEPFIHSRLSLSLTSFIDTISPHIALFSSSSPVLLFHLDHVLHSHPPQPHPPHVNVSYRVSRLQV